MPLFDARPGQVRWRDVSGLLDAGTAENELLDCKEYPGWTEFVKNGNGRVLRTVAAMANSHGGDVVVGIGETGEGDNVGRVPEQRTTNRIRRPPRHRKPVQRSHKDERPTPSR